MAQSSIAEALDSLPGRQSAWALTLTEWLMVMPAAIFAAAVLMRLLQPPMSVPARVGRTIFGWTVTHVTRLDAAVIFLALPGVALAAGSTALSRLWRRDGRFREHSAAAFTILRRQLQPLCLAAGALLAAGLLALAIHQMIVG